MTKPSATPPTTTPPRPQDQVGIHRRFVQGIAGKAVGTTIIVRRTNSARAGFSIVLKSKPIRHLARGFLGSIFTGLFRMELNFSLVVAGIIYHVILYYVFGFFIRTTAKRRTL